MISSHLEKLKYYFDQNQSMLQEWYPGITFQILKREFLDFCRLHSLDPEGMDASDKIFLYFEGVKEGVPLSYLCGQHHFYGREFFVNESTLIPRQETELLVEKGLGVLSTCESPDVLEIGTGSGVITLTMALEYLGKAKFLATDISEGALAVAKANAWKNRYGLHPQVNLDFVIADRFDGVKGRFDLIISNPPYIKREKDESLVHRQVLRFEPHLALFLPDDDYHEWFRSFFTSSFQNLKEGGTLLMEGHENHLEDLAELAADIGFSKTVCEQDLAGATRFLRGHKE